MVRAVTKLRKTTFSLWLFFVLCFWLSTALAQQAEERVKAMASIGMTVSDMDRSVEFYSEALSFKKVSDIEIEGAEYEHLMGVFGLRIHMVRMQLSDEFIELVQYIAPSDGKPIPIDSHSNDLWFQHLAIVVGDMDKAYEHIRKYKIHQISTSPQTLPKSNKPAAGIRAFKFKDPDGHPLELLWLPNDKGDPRWHNHTDKLLMGIDHTAIAVSNTEASLKFYRDLLGLNVVGGSLNTGTEQEHLDNVFGATVRITALRPPIQPPGIEFLEYDTPLGGRPTPPDVRTNDIVHWQITLIVNDVEAVAKRLRENNIRFVSDQVRTLPDDRLGFKRGVIVLDPDGHAVELVEGWTNQYAKEALEGLE
jgi:catechol 2,3-dioxygenase-like lactoylglutathione lyase family enzyme